MGNVQQFMGIDSLFLGSQSLSDPVLLTLQEDMITLLMIAFDKKLEDKLPRGHVQLLAKVK